MAGGSFHAQNGAAAMNRQQEGHSSSLEDAEVLKMLDMTAEDLAFMRRLGWTPESASCDEAGACHNTKLRALQCLLHIVILLDAGQCWHV